MSSTFRLNIFYVILGLFTASLVPRICAIGDDWFELVVNYQLFFRKRFFESGLHFAFLGLVLFGFFLGRELVRFNSLN